MRALLTIALLVATAATAAPPGVTGHHSVIARKKAAAGAGPTNPGPENLIFYADLDESSGGTAQTDRLDIQGQYHLTDNNTTASRAGKSGNGGDFVAGDSNYLSSSDVPLDIHTGSFSVSFWLNLDSLPGSFSQGLVGQYGSTEAQSHWLVFLNQSDSKIKFLVRDGVGTTSHLAAANAAASTGTSYHIVAVRNVNDLQLYIDGALQTTTATFSGTENTGAVDFEIGRYASDANRVPDGLIDEVAIFSDALTQNEIDWLYNSGTGRFFSDIGTNSPTNTDVLAWWDLDEASGTRDNAETTASRDLSDSGSTGNRAGKVSNAVDLDGTTYLTTTGISDTFHQSPYTVAGWFFVDVNPTTSTGLLGQYGTATEGEKHWTVFHDSATDKITLRMRDTLGTNYSAVANTGTSTATPYFFAGVRRGDVLTLYIDDTPQTEYDLFANTENTSAEQFDLGRILDSASRIPDGYIDEAVIFTRALTGSEILHLYNSGSGITYSGL